MPHITNIYRMQMDNEQIKAIFDKFHKAVIENPDKMKLEDKEWAILYYSAGEVKNDELKKLAENKLMDLGTFDKLPDQSLLGICLGMKEGNEELIKKVVKTVLLRMENGKFNSKQHLAVLYQIYRKLNCEKYYGSVMESLIKQDISEISSYDLTQYFVLFVKLYDEKYNLSWINLADVKYKPKILIYQLVIARLNTKSFE